jgi:hypothetical protein
MRVTFVELACHTDAKDIPFKASVSRGGLPVMGRNTHFAETGAGAQSLSRNHWLAPSLLRGPSGRVFERGI